MKFSFFSPKVLIYLRVAQAICAIIVLGCTANTTSVASFGANNFLLFASLWTILEICFLTFIHPRWLPDASDHRNTTLPPFALEVVTDIFWFAGFIALAAVFGGAQCSGTYEDISWATTGTWCQTTKVSIAFGAISWALFAASSVYYGRPVFAGRAFFNRSATPAAAATNDVEKGIDEPATVVSTTLPAATTAEEIEMSEIAAPAAVDELAVESK
ncbi:membrane-associating domain-containing protein [Kockiozyma suomiensis]|uniref:membrane-associating domain-containing protein n=1 Tax=Kockiozyma suomiensis TaxID=1337062 RepID=UPI003343A1A4